MASSLLELRNISRHFHGEGVEVKALDRINLRINKGEFVAIMGQSGSGKSSLMNILGCLDTPSAGQYLVKGHDTASLGADILSALRLKTFGFVFQRYQLLANISALHNVALPAIYAGADEQTRRQRAQTLLAKVGLSERTHHKPAELSGGQQQRVSVARALINNAEVILADEPTGALDSNTGAQLLALLKSLNREGVTVILITHDAEIAAHAERQVTLQDGKIVSDSLPQESQPAASARGSVHAFPSISAWAAVQMALSSLKTHLFRTLLTLLGVIIGVAAVVSMMAIGEGGKRQVLDRIASIGTNLISVRPGGANMRTVGDIATLSMQDASAIQALAGITHVAPQRSGRATVRYSDKDFSGRITGTTAAYQFVKDWQMAEGVFFSERDVTRFSPVVVLGSTVANALFAQQQAVGEYVLIKHSLYQVIGVLKAKGASAGGNDLDDEVLVPISTARLKIFGRDYLSAIAVKAADSEMVSPLAKRITQLLTERHGQQDVIVRTTESLVEAVTETQDTLTWLLASVAAISLLVGGIGVMNIMLVNVSERKREIGIRMATGAKPQDILKQFNIEAWVVCLLGGAIGILLGYLIGFVLSQFGHAVAYSFTPPAIAFLTALAIGVVFGYAPAHKAARLHPIDALAED